MKIGFIGGGNMACAMVRGVLASNLKTQIYIYSKGRTEQIASEFGISACASEAELAKCADIVILAVKPKDYEAVLAKIGADLAGKVLLSLAPNFSIERLKSVVGEKTAVVRAMPNTPASVAHATSAVCFCPLVLPSQREFVLEFFGSFGAVFELDEDKFGAFTAIAGSSPAYVFIFLDALCDAAVLHGISRKMAREIATNALLGSAKMALTSEKHLCELKDEVCSPAGTTIEAVRALESGGFRTAIIDAADRCAKKAKG